MHSLQLSDLTHSKHRLSVLLSKHGKLVDAPRSFLRSLVSTLHLGRACDHHSFSLIRMNRVAYTCDVVPLIYLF